MQTLNKTVIDHFRNPRNVGRLDDATHVIDVAEEVCGDRMLFSIRVVDSVIVAVRFQALGCTPTVSLGSVLTEYLHERRIDSLVRTTALDLDDLVGRLPPPQRHVLALGMELLKRLSSAAQRTDPRAAEST